MWGIVEGKGQGGKKDERLNTAGGRIKQRGRREGGWVEPKKNTGYWGERKKVLEHTLREEEEERAGRRRKPIR